MTDQNDTAAPTPNTLPVPIVRAQRSGERRPDPAYCAQLLGRDGQRRGLRGGAPVLQAARSAYLDVEWSGPADRRSGMGQLAARRV